ncbi:peptidoglycan DD-metalloendopeptidase family protein [Halalkalibacter urbisdiaboli]|uniref:peptidoglycan DD-metalloendopeptidase family protein n=1 Tax=Halalkalibacter urbisdiaboli TaxID=1960589 RepID=UPI000B4416E2|nr:M23 family metallopeptidase [Halalkalibacter urbisdiaboli]
MRWLLKHRKQHLIDRHPNTINRFTIVLFSILMLGILGGWGQLTLAADSNSDIDVIYHVYVNQKHIGSIENKEHYDRLVEELFESYEEKDPGLSLQIGEKVDIIPEYVFSARANTEETISTLKSSLSVEANAIALVVEDKNVLYLRSEEKAEQLLNAFTLQYIDEADYEQYLQFERNGQAKTLDVDEKRITDVSFTRDVAFKAVSVDPKDILSIEEGLQLLNLGVLEEQLYQVKEGDVLGAIASKHSLTINELLKLNKDLKEDSVLQIGQELHVTAYEPVIEVLVEEARKVKEEIPFQIEVIEDDTMWKGEQTVKQEGEIGYQISEYETLRKNGQTIKRELIAEEVIEEPVTKTIVKGTKEMPSRGSGSLGWPAVGGYISSYQGNRWGRFHRGVDIARPSNYNILAADNGVVTYAGNNGGYGNMVRINHNNGMETLYAHLRSIDVNVGQTVTKGQKIGVMGSTGNSTGIHLHFEVYENNSLKDPMDYLN